MFGAGQLVQFVAAFAFVLGLMVFAGRFMSKHGMGAHKNTASAGATVEVLARRGVSRGASVAIVRAGGKDLIVGVTDTAVNLLGEADPEAMTQQATEAQWTQLPGGEDRPSPSWKTLLDAMREKTVRKR